MPTPGNTEPQPQERLRPNQTCENEVLRELEAEKDRVCEGIPRPSCRPALAKLRAGKKLKGSSVRGISRAQIEERINRMEECLALRSRIQDECYGGVPDKIHQDAMDELNEGLQNCRELLEEADSLSPEAQARLLPPGW